MTTMDSPSAPQKPKLPDRVRWAIRSRHYSRRTEQSYCHWTCLPRREPSRRRQVKRYIFFHGKRHPSQMAAEEITQFLSSLALEGRVAASTQNQALSALLFLYREVLQQDLPWLNEIVHAKRPIRLPVVLTREEMQAVLAHLRGTPRLMGTLLYGAGLRLLECAQLRIKDVDFGLKQIVVRNGKGQKDRVTLLPATVKPDLARHLEAVRQQHQRDLTKGAGWVELPGGLERKYPKHDDDLYPRPEPGTRSRSQSSRPAGNPAHPSATTARKQPAGRNRLQAPAAYPGRAQCPSSRAWAFADKGIPSEPVARRTEIGCSGLQP